MAIGLWSTVVSFTHRRRLTANVKRCNVLTACLVQREASLLCRVWCNCVGHSLTIVGIASCSPARRAVIVNLGILEERDEANRLLCMSMGEFDSTDIGHVEWRCACRAASSRSRVGGGLPLSAIGTMCPALARREGRCHCRVAFDAIALVLVCILGIASFSSMRRAVIVNLVILEERDEADRLMCTLAGEFDLNDIGHDWCCACQAPWARSWVGGGLPLLSFDAMCRVLDWRKGRQVVAVIALSASAIVWSLTIVSASRRSRNASRGDCQLGDSSMHVDGRIRFDGHRARVVSCLSSTLGSFTRRWWPVVIVNRCNASTACSVQRETVLPRRVRCKCFV
jgi:hypothetical protein